MKKNLLKMKHESSKCVEQSKVIHFCSLLFHTTTFHNFQKYVKAKLKLNIGQFCSLCVVKVSLNLIINEKKIIGKICLCSFYVNLKIFLRDIFKVV